MSDVISPATGIMEAFGTDTTVPTYIIKLDSAWKIITQPLGISNTFEIIASCDAATLIGCNQQFYFRVSPLGSQNGFCCVNL